MVERMIRLLIAMEIAMRMLLVSVTVDWSNTRGASRATSKTLGGLE